MDILLIFLGINLILLLLIAFILLLSSRKRSQSRSSRETSKDIKKIKEQIA